MNNTNGQDELAHFQIIDNVPPNKCNCDGVILPKIGSKIIGKEQEFCPRCECKYENRNTKVIAVSVWVFRIVWVSIKILMVFFIYFQVVVILVILIISLLCIYMFFLSLLDPLLNKRAKANYQEQIDVDISTFHLHKFN